MRDVYFGTVHQVLPADGIGFYRFGRDTTPVLESRSTLSDRFMYAYEGTGRRDDPVLELVLEHGLPADSHHLVSPRRWDSSGARSVLLGEGLAYSMEAPLIESGSVVGTINFARATDGKPFCEEDLTSAGFISEHLSLAMERARRWDDLGEWASLLEGTFDHFPHGVVVSDLDGRRLFSNRGGRNILDSPGHARETSRDRAIGGLFDEAVVEFLESGRKSATTNVRDNVTGKKIIVKSYRAPSQDSVISLVYECIDEQAKALPVWGVLSPREQEIATLVSQGLTTKRIAQKAFVSENTVKQHLKRIFAKTDVHNRAELVQLIWTSGDPRGLPDAQ
ncbi:LuxR C-terminal-related transcriptional regulator [Streptomyces sp. NBRC 109706]|uniref:LuxR C-terminal-related transcriptional regulator n=1 Tax=Streptomyces sp. NBRC 109706 TaxID=1550035 RepID=UPI00131DA932|nr:LuxR C-terminal-related transcriptional regulator [Streptomyces sp. NBRC 109706]